MSGNHTADPFVSRQLDEFLTHLAGVCEGSVEAVHQARVAMRRLREEVSLAANHYDAEELAVIRRRLKRAAKALSHLRDADVGQRLLQNVTARVSPDPAVVSRLVETLKQDREVAFRKALKTLERLKVHSLKKDVQSARRRVRRQSARIRSSFRNHLASRASDVRFAMERAGGVYFPNRLHSARIAIKRLRYAIELADRMDFVRPAGALGPLKKAQELLGEAHDREVLADALIQSPTNSSESADDVARLEQAVRSEIRELHQQYLGLRPEIVAVCDACETVTPQRPIRRVLMAAGIAVPSLLLLRAGLGQRRTA